MKIIDNENNSHKVFERDGEYFLESEILRFRENQLIGKSVAIFGPYSSQEEAKNSVIQPVKFEDELLENVNQNQE